MVVNKCKIRATEGNMPTESQYGPCYIPGVFYYSLVEYRTISFALKTILHCHNGVFQLLLLSVN